MSDTNKKVLITGITGQDGSYMAEYCLDSGCIVYGMVRRTSTLNDRNFKHLYSNPNFNVVSGDLLDSTSLNGLVRDIKPDYFINLAAQSFVGDSWKIPEETFTVDAVGVLKCLESIRNYAPLCRFYNAGSSEEFGDVSYSPQDEKHPFKPRSPYGAAKCAAHHLVKVYRESYGIYAVQGLLFNHESERRGEEFVTRKITKGIARIVNAINKGERFDPIILGNIHAKRDWSHAKDFVHAIWLMLNQDQFNPYLKEIADNLDETHNSWNQDIIPNLKEYVVASGETHTIKEFIDKALQIAGIKGDWFFINNDTSNPSNEVLTQDETGNILVCIDARFYRPAEVNLLWGNPSLIQKELGWKPNISFDELVKVMVESDLNEKNSID